MPQVPFLSQPFLLSDTTARPVLEYLSYLHILELFWLRMQLNFVEKLLVVILRLLE